MHPQTRLVHSILANGDHLTRLTAMHYGIANLTARISDLRRLGFNIHCETKRDHMGKRYGVFTLVSSATTAAAEAA